MKKRKSAPVSLLQPFTYHLGKTGWYGVVRHPAGALGCFRVTDPELLNALYLHRLNVYRAVDDYGADPVIDDVVSAAEERQSDLLLGGAR